MEEAHEYPTGKGETEIERENLIWTFDNTIRILHG